MGEKEKPRDDILDQGAVFEICRGDDGQAAGPFEVSTLTQMAAMGQFTSDRLVWKNGMTQWTKAGTIDELKDLFTNTKSPIPSVE